MRRALPFLATAALLAYPPAVYFGLRAWGLAGVAPVLLAIFVLRFVTTRRDGANKFFATTSILALIGTVLVALSWIFKNHGWMLYYPVAVNLVMLAVFGTSLVKPPPIIERLARLKTPDLPPHAVRYTRRVTQVWCGFFLVNGAVALATCLHDDLKLWTLYNGAVSYVLIGLLFAGEWLVRRRVQRRWSDTARK